MADDGYSIERLRRQYLDFVGSKREEIEEQKISRHYYHGDQYTSAEIAVYKKRKQPVVTANAIDRKINGIVGVLERMRQDPKAYARTPQHEEGAEIVTATLRYVLDNEEWVVKSAEICRNAAINGIGGLELSLAPTGKPDDQDIDFDIVDPDAFFYDPRSFRSDFSDALYMGTARWVDLETAIAMFPDKADELNGLISTGSDTETWQQQDREKRWIDTDEKRIRLVEHWHKMRGEWWVCFYVSQTELMRAPSPFIDEDGKTFCRYVMFSANVDHDGDRYGFVRNLKSLQDEKNARRSLALHVSRSRRIIAMKGSLEDIEKTRREAARPDGVIEWETEKPEFDDLAKQADLAAQLAFLEETKTEIENFGPNPAVLGQGVEKQSGRAINLLQQAGIAELGPFVSAFKGWKVRVYRAIWNLIQRNWSAERWVRVTDSDGVAQLLPVNKLDTQNNFPVLVNALGELDVDIILDEGPDTLTMEQDAYEMLMQSGTQMPPDVIIELLPIKQDVKKKLLGRLEQAGQPNPMQVQGAQIELAQAAAKVDETKANTVLKLSQAGAAQQPQQGGPEMPTSAETMETLAKVEETRANTILKYAQADKTRMDTSLAPQQMAQKAAADEARARTMASRQPA